jgi:hypothetical protein
MIETMTKRRASGGINEEHVCVDSFIQHLREIDNRQEITYREEPNDPPDFWVTIAGVTYAAEATSIVTDYDYDVLCKKLIKIIHSESQANNGIKGVYALKIVRRPEIPRRRTTQWRALVSIAATKIREMSDSPCEAESCLLKDANGYLAIRKCSDQGSTIGLLGTPAMKWEGETQWELSQLFKKAIETKRERLQNKGILDLTSNIILLFYDAYGYASIEDVRKAFLNVQGYEWLHSIFLALSFSDIPNKLYPDTPGRRGVFLYSRNEKWR